MQFLYYCLCIHKLQFCLAILIQEFKDKYKIDRISAKIKFIRLNKEQRIMIYIYLAIFE